MNLEKEMKKDRRTFGEFVFDIVPTPIFRVFLWVKDRPRHIKWWFQRANGTLPECDLWDFKNTLADTIEQGVDYLLRENGHIAFVGEDAKMKKDLLEVRRWVKEYRYLFLDNHTLIAKDEDEKKELSERYDLVITQDEYNAYVEKQDKAFKYLSRNFLGLWD